MGDGGGGTGRSPFHPHRHARAFRQPEEAGVPAGEEQPRQLDPGARRVPAADEAPSAAGDASRTARAAGLLYPGNTPASCTSQDKALKLPKGPPLLMSSGAFHLAAGKAT